MRKSSSPRASRAAVSTAATVAARAGALDRRRERPLQPRADHAPDKRSDDGAAFHPPTASPGLPLRERRRGSSRRRTRVGGSLQGTRPRRPHQPWRWTQSAGGRPALDRSVGRTSRSQRAGGEGFRRVVAAIRRRRSRSGGVVMRRSTCGCRLRCASTTAGRGRPCPRRNVPSATTSTVSPRTPITVASASTSGSSPRGADDAVATARPRTSRCRSAAR